MLRYVIVVACIATVAHLGWNATPIHALIAAVLIWTPLQIIAAIVPRLRNKPATGSSDTPATAQTVEMDGVRLVIAYCDGDNRRTRRTIRCEELTFEQTGCETNPLYLNAWCETRRANRTFIPERIFGAWTIDGQEIVPLYPFLFAHADIDQ